MSVTRFPLELPALTRACSIAAQYSFLRLDSWHSPHRHIWLNVLLRALPIVAECLPLQTRKIGIFRIARFHDLSWRKHTLRLSDSNKVRGSCDELPDHHRRLDAEGCPELR